MPDIPLRIRLALERHSWEETIPRLVHYTLAKVRRLYWRGTRGGDLPGGQEAKDIVNKTIEKVFTGARRWDPGRQPDLPAFLRNAIDSELNNLAESWENRLFRRETREPPDLAAGDARNPDGAGEDFARGFLDFLADDPQLRSIAERIVAGSVKPGAIAAELELEAREIYNMRKRLRRRLNDYLARRKIND